MDKEKSKALKHQEKMQNEHSIYPTQHNTYTGPTIKAGPSLKTHSSQATDNKTSNAGISTPQKNLEGFAAGKGIIMGERVDHVAANQQMVRAEELRELVDLG